MATGVISWSQTAASNATADSNVGWAEGQAPSTVNDSARAMMASAAKWRDDISGTIVTGGSGTAYTITSNQIIAANTNGMTVQFTPGTTNTNAVTLSVDGNTAKPIRFLTGVDLPAGALISGSLYQATYRLASDEWLLHSFDSSIYSIPIAGSIDYFGTTVPNGAFVFPAGQAISRILYAVAFARMGTTFGAGDGSTTFNVPDLMGRVTAMKEAVATRLTTAVSGVDGATLGSAGGAQSKTLLTANLPAYTPAGTVSVTSTLSDWVRGGTPDVYVGGGAGAIYQNPSKAAVVSTGSLTGAAQGGTSTPFAVVQPLIICNRILRII